MTEGERLLQRLRTKVNKIASRDLKKFMAGKIPILWCSGDRLDAEIAREFDRLLSSGERADG